MAKKITGTFQTFDEDLVKQGVPENGFVTAFLLMPEERLTPEEIAQISYKRNFQKKE